MQNLTKTFPAWAAASVAVVGVAAALSSQVVVNAGATPLKTATAAAAVAAVQPAAAAAVAAVQPAAPAAVRAAETLSAAVQRKTAPAVIPVSQQAVRSMIKFETVRWGGKPVKTLDEASRILLAKAAAEKAGLHDVGLSFHDVYGVIEAETSWIPRTGSSKNGTPNLGLAQFEPRTAKGLGVTDPQDPVQAVFGAAMYMKEGARWASGKIDHLNLAPAQRYAKVREGVSVYYNLSVKGRNKWNGVNAATLPIETQRHIQNVAVGVTEAAQLARSLSI